jgi:hypothetical protein
VIRLACAPAVQQVEIASVFVVMAVRQCWSPPR